MHGSGLGWIFTAFFGVFGWAIGLAKLSDNSFFWHLRTGEYILDHGIPHHDVFSYTAPGTKWVAQSWLAEVAYAALYRSMGGFGIRLLVGLVGAGIGMLTYRLALRLVRDRLVACGLTAAALAGIYTVWSERPLLFGVLFLLVLLWTVEVPDSFVGRHPLVVVPVLMWLWANTHGTYQLGFAYLGLHLLGRWLDGAPPWAGRERRLLIAAAVAFAAVFVNPYGVGPGHVPDRAPVARRHPLAHRRVEVARLPSGMGRRARHLDRRLPRGARRAVVTGSLAATSWSRCRCCCSRSGPRATSPSRRSSVCRSSPEPSPATRRSPRSCAAPWWPPRSRCSCSPPSLMGYQASTEKDFDFRTYPVASMRYLERHDLMGKRLLTTDAAAGYVILEDWPQQKVFIDDRYDMYPTSVIYDYFDLTGAKPGWSRVLDKYDVDVIVWGKDTALGVAARHVGRLAPGAHRGRRRHLAAN